MYARKDHLSSTRAQTNVITHMRMRSKAKNDQAQTELKQKKDRATANPNGEHADPGHSTQGDCERRTSSKITDLRGGSSSIQMERIIGLA